MAEVDSSVELRMTQFRTARKIKCKSSFAKIHLINWFSGHISHGDRSHDSQSHTISQKF